MIKINEIIIVEGTHDISFLSSFIDTLFIKTDGSSLPSSTIQEIKTYQKLGKKFIILTDPDYPGDKIRNKLLEIIPDAKVGFLDKKFARTSKKVGVEHATSKYILEVLDNLITLSNSSNNLTNNDLLDLGLNGYPNSNIYREKVSLYLHIGKCNAKQFLKRINCLNITKKELEKIIKEIC